MPDLIFVVDGESIDRRRARFSLEQAGYAVRTFASVVGLHEALDRGPALLLIAAQLPDGSGMDLCRDIRQRELRPRVPVILLSPDNSAERHCAALAAGADSHLAKPFTSRELIARVHAAMHSPGTTGQADILIDHNAMRLSVRGNDVVTTSLEFRLMNYLARNRGHALTRDVLLDAVWGETYFVSPRTVDACVRRIREKIEPDVTHPTYLKTVRGIGYRFDGIAVWPNPMENCNCAACRPSNTSVIHPNSSKLDRRSVRPRAYASPRQGSATD